MCKMQIAVARPTQLCRTERANDRLITAYATFLAIASNQTATLQFVLCTMIHNFRKIVADCVGLFFAEETKTKYCLGIRKNVRESGRSGAFGGL